MRTTLIILISLSTTTTLSFGQKFSVGSEFGFISSINTDFEIADLENRRNTFYSSLNLNYKYDDRLSFTTGLNYLRQGYRHSTCYIFKEGVKNELVGKIDYLAIPISVNIHFFKSRKLVSTFGLLGAYNIKAVQDYPKPIGGCEIYYTPDLTNVLKRHSIIGIIGLGYIILENDIIELTTNIKFYQGLTNIMNNPYPNITWVDRHSSLLLTLNFNYKL